MLPLIFTKVQVGLTHISQYKQTCLTSSILQQLHVAHSGLQLHLTLVFLFSSSLCGRTFTPLYHTTPPKEPRLDQDKVTVGEAKYHGKLEISGNISHPILRATPAEDYGRTGSSGTTWAMRDLNGKKPPDRQSPSQPVSATLIRHLCLIKLQHRLLTVWPGVHAHPRLTLPLLSPTLKLEASRVTRA